MSIKNAPEYRATINNANGPFHYQTDVDRQRGLAASEQAKKDRGY